MCKIINILSNNIRMLRKRLDLTQEQFAELAELSLRNITNIENGQHLPKAKNIDKICEKLNIECYELFIDHSKIKSKNEKLLEINSMLERLEEDQLENVYKIVSALSNE